MTSDVLRTVDLTFRIFVLIVAITLGALVILVGGRDAMAASIKPTAVISENVFTVGDVFSGLSDEKASRVLGAARVQPRADVAKKLVQAIGFTKGAQALGQGFIQ